MGFTAECDARNLRPSLRTLASLAIPRGLVPFCVKRDASLLGVPISNGWRCDGFHRHAKAVNTPPAEALGPQTPALSSETGTEPSVSDAGNGAAKQVNGQDPQAYRLSVAPMMDWTDRHCRTLHRLMTQRAMLYTEMVTAPAILHGPKARLLDFGPQEHPIALQLGGSDPRELATATQIAQSWSYDEINLNCGCPSDRVQSGAFGAVLMESPQVVASCVAAMQAESAVPITVKCRIGVDDQIPEDILPRFLETVANAGVRHFVIHARKAWLKGLSPKENREIPPLNHALVIQMKQRFPELTLCINGGITTLAQAQSLLDQGLDGVMVGRAAYHDPASVLVGADSLWGQDTGLSEEKAVLAMIPYIEAHLSQGGKLHQITRHMLGLFAGRPGARGWRRLLSEGANRPDAGPDLVLRGLAEVIPPEALS